MVQLTRYATICLLVYGSMQFYSPTKPTINKKRIASTTQWEARKENPPISIYTTLIFSTAYSTTFSMFWSPRR